jgi:hypothetical protein
MAPTLRTLLARSDNMDGAWRNVLAPASAQYVPGAVRERLALDACALVLTHGQAIRLLLSSQLENPALALLRVQHEALLRAAWLAHAAADADIAALTAPQTDEALKQANQLPLPSVLLRQVEASDAPDALKQGLREFRDIAWAGANSYTHAGLLPLGHVGTGHAELVLVQALHASNAHAYAACMISATFLGTSTVRPAINRVAIAHADCMAWR